MLRFVGALCFAILALVPQIAASQTSFTTLGTQAGPIPIPGRSQPANLFRVAGTQNLLDCGDNTAHQLFKAGVQTRELDRVFISHLHGDHVGGLFAILALRAQTNPENTLEIYGPPGTVEMVDGLLAAMAPALRAGYGVPGAPAIKPEELAVAREIKGGESLELPGFKLTAAKNTHYSFAPDSSEAEAFQSLSYRFDFEDRSIVFTGDTGPSDAVIALAKEADMLVGEVFEVAPAMGLVRAQAPNLSDQDAKYLEVHMRTHHLTAQDLGQMARKANVGQLVVTHIGTDHRSFKPEAMRDEIAQEFGGKITIAADLQSF